MRKVAALALIAGLLAACLIADPLPEQRSLPTRKPSILSADAPSSTGTLTALPSSFVVKVQLYNPSVGFQWGVFVDYDPTSGARATPRGIEPPRSDAPDVQIVNFSLPTAIDPDRCHSIEFIVALSFVYLGSHEADAAGADSVTWYYVPGGDFSKCASYDAGVPDAGPVDAGRDASDASP